MSSQNKALNLGNGPDELKRLASLYAYDILDTAPEKEFEDLTAYISNQCEAPIVMITFIDSSRLWFKSQIGIDLSQSQRKDSICDHVISTQRQPFIVEDASADPRFKDHPLIKNNPFIISYLGVPLVNRDGFALGTLCVAHPAIKTYTPQQIALLKVAGTQIMDKMELRLSSAELDQTRSQLAAANESGHLGNFEYDIKNQEFILDSKSAEHLGFDEKGTQGLPDVLGHIFPEYQDLIITEINNSVDRKRFFHAECAIGRSKQNLRWISIDARVIKAADQQKIKLVGVTNDITLQKDLKEERGRFLGKVSHELKTPVASLKSGLQLLQSFPEINSHPAMSKMIERCLKGANRITDLGNASIKMYLLDTSRIALQTQIEQVLSKKTSRS